MGDRIDETGDTSAFVRQLSKLLVLFALNCSIQVAVAVFSNRVRPTEAIRKLPPRTSNLPSVVWCVFPQEPPDCTLEMLVEFQSDKRNIIMNLTEDDLVWTTIWFKA
jgi:hypothetical protein